MKMKKLLCAVLALALTLCMGLSLAQPAFAAGYFETNANGWHYRYYYSGYIELGYHIKGSEEHVTGFCDGNPYFYTVLLADSKIKSISFDLQLTNLPESFASNSQNL